jgi:hypothetical protein
MKKNKINFKQLTKIFDKLDEMGIVIYGMRISDNKGFNIDMMNINGSSWNEVLQWYLKHNKK